MNFYFCVAIALQAIVNNAGVTAVTEVEWCPLETYRDVLEVNALGPIRVTQAFLPILRKRAGSRVVIVASLAGKFFGIMFLMEF